MILTESSSRVGASAVGAIVSTSETFRQFLCYSSTTISHAISGSIGLVKNGIARLTLTGIANYTGPTIINEGGEFLISSSSTLNGIISGSGRLWKNGSSTLTLGATNTYSGGTEFYQGIIVFNASDAFGTGLFIAKSGGEIRTGGNLSLQNDFLLNINFGLRTTGAPTVILTGDISGVGGINKYGNGFFNLYGTLTYTGLTNIQAGSIRAKKTVGESTATAQFQYGGLSLVVSFDVSPPSGTTNFRFFLGATNQSYASTAISLSGVPAGTTATYTSATSTLAVTVP